MKERRKKLGLCLGSEEMTDAFGADRSPSIVTDKNGIITFSESGVMTELNLKRRLTKL